MIRVRNLLISFIFILPLVGCGDNREPLQIGGKQSVEDQIIAELVAELAEAAGIPVQRRIGLGDSRLMLEALKRGEVDLYPEHTGAGFALLGFTPPTDADADADPEAALGFLAERYASLGLAWSEPLGFENEPALAMLGERATSLGIRNYSDLARYAEQLTLGIDSDWRARPVDGLGPLGRRYGMQFGKVLEVDSRDYLQLYDHLIDGEVDVALIRSADPQAALFDVRVLEDNLGFFPRYAGALVYRAEALERFPALEGVFEQLDGAIGDQQISELIRRVTIRGEDPREVVREQLIQLDLIDGEIGERNRQALNLAVSLSANADGEAGTILRQLRRSFPTSTVNLIQSKDPLSAVEDASARIALVSAPAFFSPGSIDSATGQPPLRQGIEAVALVGTSFLHTFALQPSITRLEDATVIATGPEGSSSFRAAQSIIDGLQLTAKLQPVEGDSPVALADALVDSGADVAILMQPVGNSTALALLQQGLPLMEVSNWIQANNRIVFPYLQPATLSPADYARFFPAQDGDDVSISGFREPIETLSTQLVLAAPSPLATARLSTTQGPGASFVPRALPLTDQVVGRINAATASSEDIYPILPQARALSPQLPKPPEPLNPSPATSALAMLALVLLIWLVWLLVRPIKSG